MKEARILITGSTGCVGQYTCNWLLKNTYAHLLLHLRDPKKLSAIDTTNPRISLLIGDIRNIERFSDELANTTHVIHTATAWGDVKRTYEVNIVSVKKLLSLLDHNKLKKIIYFSTASILDFNLDPLPEAIKYGTEYIQTKAKCLKELEKHIFSEKIVAVFPTLVFGGSYNSKGPYPASYLTQGIQDAIDWLWLARWFKGFSRFHFIHAEDIAFICGQLLTNDHYTNLPRRKKGITKYVMGQKPISIDQAILALLKWKGMKRVPSLPLWSWLIELMVSILPIQITEWDRFSIKQRHFTHSHVISPEELGGQSHAKSLNEILLKSGLPKGKKSN